MTDLDIDIAGGVAQVVINRAPVNALTLASYRELLEAFTALGENQAVRCVILTGAGSRAFCAGFDFRHFANAGASEDDPLRPEIMRNMFSAIRHCPVPVIGAINGPAIGTGCVLAAVCDMRIAAEGAKFGLPEIDFGRIGGAAYLNPLLPPGMMRRLAFTGKPIDALAALHLGLVEEVVPLPDLAATALALAQVIAAKPAAALRHTKAALNDIETMSAAAGYRAEQDASLRLRAKLEGGA